MSMLDSVTNKGSGLPPRIIMHSQEKFGKTSFAAYAPTPIFAMTRGETGLLSLIDAGLVPKVDYYPQDFKDWMLFIDFLCALRDDRHNYKTLVVDTGNGLGDLCCDHVLREVYGGDEVAFSAYAKGVASAMVPWQRMITTLDEIREKRKMMIIFLHHTKAKHFDDPSGKSYDRWIPEGQEKLWGITCKWADVILSGQWETQTQKIAGTKDERAVGMPTRYLQASTVASTISGNRYGVKDKITGNGAKGLWDNLQAELDRALNRGGRPAEQSNKQQGQQSSTQADQPADKPKKSRYQISIDYWKNYNPKPETFADDFVNAIERFHTGNVKSKYLPAEEPDVREYIREALNLGDMVEFKDFTIENVKDASLAVVGWLKKHGETPALKADIIPPQQQRN